MCSLSDGSRLAIFGRELGTTYALQLAHILVEFEALDLRKITPSAVGA